MCGLHQALQPVWGTHAASLLGLNFGSFLSLEVDWKKLLPKDVHSLPAQSELHFYILWENVITSPCTERISSMGYRNRAQTSGFDLFLHPPPHIQGNSFGWVQKWNPIHPDWALFLYPAKAVQLHSPNSSFSQPTGARSSPYERQQQPATFSLIFWGNWHRGLLMMIKWSQGTWQPVSKCDQVSK